jgi:hypothetical protein
MCVHTADLPIGVGVAELQLEVAAELVEALLARQLGAVCRR